MMRALARLSLYSFAGVVIVWGLSGIFFAQWWLATVFPLRLESLDAPTRVTFVNEFRFLQARELGVGLFAWFFHREILTSRKHNAVFLAVVFAAPLARLYSCLADGWPRGLWQLFMVSEIAMGLTIWVCTRRTLVPTSPPAA